MKYMILNGMLAATMGVMSLSAAHAETGAKLIDVLPDQIFAPASFDDNDNAQVVLRGVFSDTCYRSGPAKAKIDLKTKQIVIRAKAYRYANEDCQPRRTPWVKTVDLGLLPAGTYSVVARQPGKSDTPASVLPISVARTSAPDDFEYAVVSDAVASGLDKGAGTGPEIELFGTHHMTCLQLKEVAVHYREPNVVEVLPIVGVNANVPCAYPFLPIPFKQSVRLERRWSGPVLIHVRSADGTAVNRVIELP